MDDRLVRWRCAHRGSLPSTDIRQIPGGCEARIPLLTGLGNQNAKRDPGFERGVFPLDPDIARRPHPSRSSRLPATTTMCCAKGGEPHRAVYLGAAWPGARRRGKGEAMRPHRRLVPGLFAGLDFGLLQRRLCTTAPAFGSAEPNRPQILIGVVSMTHFGRALSLRST